MEKQRGHDSSGPPHFQQPCLVCWLYSCTQGSAVPSLLEVAEEELSGWETAGGLLLLHHRKYPGLLCNGAVCQMLCSRWKGYPEHTKHRKKTTSCALSSLEEMPLRSLKENHQRQFHLGHLLFDLLPSDRHYRFITTRTNRLKKSSYLSAVTILNQTWLL